MMHCLDQYPSAYGSRINVHEAFTTGHENVLDIWQRLKATLTSEHGRLSPKAIIDKEARLQARLRCPWVSVHGLGAARYMYLQPACQPLGPTTIVSLNGGSLCLAFRKETEKATFLKPLAATARDLWEGGMHGTRLHLLNTGDPRRMQIFCRHMMADEKNQLLETDRHDETCEEEEAIEAFEHAQPKRSTEPVRRTRRFAFSATLNTIAAVGLVGLGLVCVHKIY